MTDSVDIDRIDIVEGPNLEGLIKPWLMAEAEMQPQNRPVALRFDRVHFYVGDSRVPSEELGSAYMPYLIALGTLGGVWMTRTRADYVITVASAAGTFEGHYNTKTRKGSLRRK